MTPDEVVAEVAEALAHLRRGAAAVVAMSGGPDSAALAVAVGRARPDLVVRGAHVRHGLRAADEVDARIARAQGAALDIPVSVHQVRVDARRDGIAAAARHARYDALAVVAAAGSAPLLVAHTADDQAETVLLNLGRGTGLRGLAGMRTHARWNEVAVLRPLLGVRRGDARALAAGLETATDPTNMDPARRRTRVREELLPALARVSGGPGDPVGVLWRIARLAQVDADALDELAGQHARQMLLRWGPGSAVRVAALEGLPEALHTRVLRRLLTNVAPPGTEVSYAAVDAVRHLQPGQRDVDGGVRVTRDHTWVAAAPIGAAIVARRIPPDGVHLPELGLRIVWQETPRPGPVPPGGDRTAGVSPPLAPSGGLQVRGWRRGDRFASAGGKVADALQRRGIPRVLRALVPVVVDSDGRCWWAAGVGGVEADNTRLLHVALSQ